MKFAAAPERKLEPAVSKIQAHAYFLCSVLLLHRDQHRAPHPDTLTAGTCGPLMKQGVPQKV
jgi:hypothetical protein